jgi:hypothetical protein
MSTAALLYLVYGLTLLVVGIVCYLVWRAFSSDIRGDQFDDW